MTSIVKSNLLGYLGKCISVTKSTKIGGNIDVNQFLALLLLMRGRTYDWSVFHSYKKAALLACFHP